MFEYDVVCFKKCENGFTHMVRLVPIYIPTGIYETLFIQHYMYITAVIPLVHLQTTNIKQYSIRMKHNRFVRFLFQFIAKNYYEWVLVICDIIVYKNWKI